MLKFLMLGVVLCQVVVNDVSGQAEGDTELQTLTGNFDPPIDDSSYGSNLGNDEGLSFDANQQSTDTQGSTEPPIDDANYGPISGNSEGSSFNANPLVTEYQGSSEITETRSGDSSYSFTSANDEGVSFQSNQQFSGTPDLTEITKQSIDSSSYALKLGDNERYNFRADQQFFYLTSCGSKPPTGPGTGKKPARPGYVETKGIGYHKLHVGKVSWYIARKTCIDEGGHLAIIRSAAEEKLLMRMMNARGIYTGAYVGYHDSFGQGDWTTLLDEPIARLPWMQWSKKFNPNPNNYPGQNHCLQLWGDGGGLDDIHCAEPRPFICKI